MIYAQPKTHHRLRFINPQSKLSTITMPEIIRHMTFTRKALFMPVGLAVCARAVPPHWDLELIDECARNKPHQPKPDVDVVAITAMTTQAKRAYQLADAYRTLGVTVLLGGIHPSAMPEDALPHCDALARGDGETTLPHMIADWEAGLRQHKDSPLARRGLKPIYDWKDYPTAPIGTPRKDLLDPKDYLVFNPIQTTRGCPHSCTFCTTPAVFGRKFRLRSVKDIVEEIKEAKERYNSWTFIFSDDNFAGNHKWALELCAALEPLNITWASQCDILISQNDKLLAAMKRSGCVGLILGLEAVDQQTLTEAGKKFVRADSYETRLRKIQSYDISLWGAFIFGFDHDHWTDLMHACRFAQRMDLAMSCYPILTPYPGTEIWRQYNRAGRILSRDWDRYNGASVVYLPKRVTSEQLRHAQMAAFAEFFSPRSTFRRLKIYPLKKRAWLANLAIWRAIQYYYAKRGRLVPSFAHFLDPRSRAWNYGDTWADQLAPAHQVDVDSPNAQPAPDAESPAANLLTQADPLASAAQSLAVLNQANA